MKAITLIQPWATLVAIGAKKIETRSWATDYRGPLAIHAAKGFPVAARAVCTENYTIRWHLRQARIDVDELPRGVIVAVCRLVDCRRIRGKVDEPRYSEVCFGDYTPGRYAWVLEDVRPVIPPIPAKGALGLWEWEQEGR